MSFEALRPRCRSASRTPKTHAMQDATCTRVKNRYDGDAALQAYGCFTSGIPKARTMRPSTCTRTRVPRSESLGISRAWQRWPRLR